MMGGVAVAVLEGLLLQFQGNKSKQKQEKTSLESVSSSETDVTVNLSTFAELLATKKAQKVTNK